MQLARVIGAVVATRKEPAFEGIKLLLIQPVNADGLDAGRPLVAVDAVGAGAGERVFFVRGKEASFPFHPTEVPADAGIVGIVDHWSTIARPEAGQDQACASEAQPHPAQRTRRSEAEPRS